MDSNTILMVFGTRLLVALLLGMLIGAERIIAHKTAGMRTYALVSMGAALFSILSQLITHNADPASFNLVMIPAAIISGVGFLGTGLLIQGQGLKTGLTTASGLWVAAGIGICAGYGFSLLAIMTTILVLFVFVVLWLIEQRIKGSHLYEKIENAPINENDLK